MEIILLEENGEVIRKITKPVVQTNIDSGNITLSGQEEIKMANGQIYTAPMAGLCQREQVFNPQTPPTEEEQAKIDRNTAKDTAHATCLEAIRSAVSAYAVACYAIDNPVEEVE